MPLYLVIGLFFVSVVLLLFFLFSLLFPKKTAIMERLESMSSYLEEGEPLRKAPNRWQKLLGRLGGNITLRPEEYGKYMRMLIAAGMRKDRYQMFMGSKILLTIILPLLYLIAYGLPLEGNPMVRSLFTIIFAIAGFLLPSFWLSKKLKTRQTQIFHDLPHVLDLMTVCVEAGLGIDSSIVKLSEDPHLRKSPLSSEMRIAVQETLAGKPRYEALRDMGERTMVDDLKSFAAMLVQTERLGTSVAQALRVHADTLRTSRLQKAQEAAAKTSVKIVFPLVFFILPALFVVMLVPALLRLSKVLV